MKAIVIHTMVVAEGCYQWHCSVLYHWFLCSLLQKLISIKSLIFTI